MKIYPLKVTTEFNAKDADARRIAIQAIKNKIRPTTSNPLLDTF